MKTTNRRPRMHEDVYGLCPFIIPDMNYQPRPCGFLRAYVGASGCPDHRHRLDAGITGHPHMLEAQAAAREILT